MLDTIATEPKMIPKWGAHQKKCVVGPSADFTVGEFNFMCSLPDTSSGAREKSSRAGGGGRQARPEWYGMKAFVSAAERS